MLATQDPDVENSENQETPIFEKRDTFLHGPGKRGWVFLGFFFFFLQMILIDFLYQIF